MAQASRTETYDVPVEKFYKAIIDYKNYPKFVDGVKNAEVSGETEAGATVKLSISVIKEISYTIKLVHELNKKVSWSFLSGDLMKVNNGRWELKSVGPTKTEVTYSLEVELKGFMPGLGMIEKTLVNTNLPMTMKAFAKHAESM
jgi:coenzyme Q-binding protein COQ10